MHGFSTPHKAFLRSQLEVAMGQQQQNQLPQQQQQQKDQDEAAQKAREAAALDAAWTPLPEEQVLRNTIDQQY